MHQDMPSATTAKAEDTEADPDVGYLLGVPNLADTVQERDPGAQSEQHDGHQQ